MRVLDYESAFSDEDRQWLMDRDRTDLIEANDARFRADAFKDVAPDENEDTYDSWKIKELVTEGESREPVVDFTGCKTKPDFVAALRQWDIEHPDAEEV